jgi:hypothetical protein
MKNTFRNAKSRAGQKRSSLELKKETLRNLTVSSGVHAGAVQPAYTTGGNAYTAGGGYAAPGGGGATK